MANTRRSDIRRNRTPQRNAGRGRTMHEHGEPSGRLSMTEHSPALAVCCRASLSLHGWSNAPDDWW